MSASPAYRLQALLELKVRAEEAATRALAQALAQEAQARQAQAALEEDLNHRQARRAARLQGFWAEAGARGAEALDFVQMGRFEGRLKAEEQQVRGAIEVQRAAVEAAGQVVQQRRAGLRAAAAARKALERHRAAWAAARRAEQQRREELAQDEVGSALHLRARAAARGAAVKVGAP